MNEIKELQEKLASAEAAGAEMRDWYESRLMCGIRDYEKAGDWDSANILRPFAFSLQKVIKSTTLGQGWKSPAEFALLEATLEQRANEANLAERLADTLNKDINTARQTLWSCGISPSQHVEITDASTAVSEMVDGLVKERDEANSSLTINARWTKKIADLLGWNAEKSNADLRQFVEDGIAELKEWRTMLQGWGGTPEIVNDFIKGQQDRIHYCQNLERDLEAATKERDEALAFIEKAGKLMADCFNGTAREAIMAACKDIPGIVKAIDDDPVAPCHSTATASVQAIIRNRKEAIKKLRDEALAEITRLRSEIERKDAALSWYEEQSRLCRLIHSGGDSGRNALAADGGEKAKAALASAEKETKGTAIAAETREKVQSAHEQHISPKQYRDLVPGVDRYRKGDQGLTEQFGWMLVASHAFGKICDKRIRYRRPLPEVPEGKQDDCGECGTVEGATRATKMLLAAYFKRFPNAEFEAIEEARKTSIPEIPDNSSHSEIPNSSLWISQPTEPGYYWYRREHNFDKIVRIIFNRDELLIEEIGLAKFVPVTSCLNKGQFFGQFQGPIKPQEGGK